VVRVLERIAADLDSLGLVPNDSQADKESNQNDPQARHRHELESVKRSGMGCQSSDRSSASGAHLLLQTRSPVCLTPDFLTLSIADAVLWLLSEDARYVTGHTLPVDGGVCAQ
jgi:NAD(P)-dependent dehydrogenase (short-subunit alcohol dehydrogenase family)